MINRQIGIMLVLAFCFSTAALFAQERPNRASSTPMMGKGMMQKLKLTDDQKQKVEQFMLENEKEMIKLNSDIKLNRVDLKKLFAEKELNTAKLTDLTETIGKLELQIKNLRTKNWIKIYNLLSDDQKGIWIKHFEKEGFLKMDFKRFGMRPGMMQGRKPGMMQKNGMIQGSKGHMKQLKDSTATK